MNLPNFPTAKVFLHTVYVDIPDHILNWLIMHELAMHGLTADMHVLSKLPLHLFTCVSTDLAS